MKDALDRMAAQLYRDIFNYTRSHEDGLSDAELLEILEDAVEYLRGSMLAMGNKSRTRLRRIDWDQ